MSGFKITRLYAFIATDPEDGDEGIIAFKAPDNTMMPMIGADMDRVEQLHSIADVMEIDYEVKYFELEPSVP
jgi:hypothetical protein